jgi:hypothetical protein
MIGRSKNASVRQRIRDPFPDDASSFPQSEDVIVMVIGEFVPEVDKTKATEVVVERDSPRENTMPLIILLIQLQRNPR